MHRSYAIIPLHRPHPDLVVPVQGVEEQLPVDHLEDHRIDITPIGGILPAQRPSKVGQDPGHHLALSQLDRCGLAVRAVHRVQNQIGIVGQGKVRLLSGFAEPTGRGMGSLIA